MKRKLGPKQNVDAMKKGKEKLRNTKIIFCLRRISWGISYFDTTMPRGTTI